MYRTPTSGLSQEFMTGQRVWASITVAGTVLAILGMIVLPWFNKAAEFRAGAGLTLALVLMAGLREEAELSDVPSIVRGTAMNMIIAGLLSLAFMGFAGLFSSI